MASAGSRAEAVDLYARATRVYGETIGADAPESVLAASRVMALAAVSRDRSWDAQPAPRRG